MGARREVVSAVTERYRSAKRTEKGRILDALCATTGWHRKHAVRALRQHEPVRPNGVEAPRERSRRYGATIKDALTALWEASDRVCGKRLKVMIPILLPALEQHGRLKLGKADRDRVLAISVATIDRLLGDVKVAASGGRRRRAGFYTAIRREVPIRTFNDWDGPPPGFCEVDMVAHGGTCQSSDLCSGASGQSPRPYRNADDAHEVVKKLDLKNSVHIGHSTGGGEVTRYVARHGKGRVKKAVLISAIPPLFMKTDKNPDGVPMEVVDGIRGGTANHRSQFYKDITMPFYGFNRPGATGD